MRKIAEESDVRKRVMDETEIENDEGIRGVGRERERERERESREEERVRERGSKNYLVHKNFS